MGICNSTNQKKEQTKPNAENNNYKNIHPISTKETEINVNEINLDIKDDNNLKNKNLINNKTKLDEIKEEDEQEKYYLNCPICKDRFPNIINVEFDEKNKTINIIFKCICIREEKKASINEMIFKKKPDNLCPFHQSNLNLFCSTCNYFICNNCKTQHEDHSIIENQDYKDCDIDKLIKNLSIQQLDFETQCDIFEKDCEKKINQEINKLNQIKQDYKNSFNEEKKKKYENFQNVKNIL